MNRSDGNLGFSENDSICIFVVYLFFTIYRRTQSEDSFEFIDQTDLLSARLTDDYKKTIPVQIQKNTVKNQV